MSEERSDLAALSAAQRAALLYADDAARSREADAGNRLKRVLGNAACASNLFDDAMRSVRSSARVVLHFHPDRYGLKPITVAESLLADGRYRNQFETGLSAGSRTAFVGGSRDRWERDLFGGIYHGPDVVAQDRPKYGALELIRYPDGPLPRFGSCYFVLRPAVSERSTFTFGGSERADALDRLGTLANMDSAMASLLEEVAAGGETPVAWPPFVAPTLGVSNLTVCGLLARLARELPMHRPDPSAGPAGRVLDSCVEAHVHGSIDLRNDVESLVIDPSFEGTPTAEILLEVSRKYEIPSYWHCGFRMPAQDVPDDFRGPAMRPLAQRIAPSGSLDAAIIGAAEASLYMHPDEWRDWGSREETLQHLKQLWHVVVHYGEPVRPPAAERNTP